MAQLKAPCPHCQRVTNLDSEKLPDQPVSFKCPHCKGKVVVEKAKLQAATDEPAPAVRQTTVSQIQATASAPSAPVAEDDHLPPGAAIPPGMIVGEDPALVEAVRGLLGHYDCELDVVADAETAREQILLDPPSLLIYVAGSVGAPPHSNMSPIVGLPPRERRKVFLVLVAENLRTLDGNAAFMYQVNLCVNRAEVATIASAIYTGLDYHHRLYKPYHDATTS